MSCEIARNVSLLRVLLTLEVKKLAFCSTRCSEGKETPHFELGIMTKYFARFFLLVNALTKEENLQHAAMISKLFQRLKFLSFDQPTCDHASC